MLKAPPPHPQGMYIGQKRLSTVTRPAAPQGQCTGRRFKSREHLTLNSK